MAIQQELLVLERELEEAMKHDMSVMSKGWITRALNRITQLIQQDRNDQLYHADERFLDDGDHTH